MTPGKGETSSENFENGLFNNAENERFNVDGMEQDLGLAEDLAQDTYYKTEIDSGRLIVLKHNKHPVLNDTWKFKFFNLVINSKKLTNFNKETENLLDLKDKDKLARQLKIKENRREISECYTKCFNESIENFNDTSLIVFHSPIERSDISVSSLVEGCSSAMSNRKCILFSIIHDHDKHKYTGQMLCGDICSKNKDIFEEWKFHYSRELCHITFLLLPHHGSKHNWNPSIIENCRNSDVFMSSSAFSNRYGHPSLGMCMKY